MLICLGYHVIVTVSSIPVNYNSVNYMWKFVKSAPTAHICTDLIYPEMREIQISEVIQC